MHKQLKANSKILNYSFFQPLNMSITRCEFKDKIYKSDNADMLKRVQQKILLSNEYDGNIKGYNNALRYHLNHKDYQICSPTPYSPSLLQEVELPKIRENCQRKNDPKHKLSNI